MDTCKRKLVWIYFIVNLTTTFAFIISPQHAQISESTTVKPYETTPLSDLIQQQTDAIKKILSANPQNNHDINLNKHSTNNCEDIESSIKETLTRSQVAQNAQMFEPQFIIPTQKQVNVEIVTTEINDQIDTTTEINKLEISQTIIPDLKPTQTAQPSGRTLFSMFKSAEIEEPTAHQTLNAVKLNDNQNYILIPCLKRVIHNGTRQPTGGVAQNAQTFELQQPHTVQVPPPSLVLEKVHAPTGEFLYYRYKTPAISNTVEITQNVEQLETEKLEKPQVLNVKRINSPNTEFVNYRYKTADTLNNEDITPNFEHLQTPKLEIPQSLTSDKINKPASDLLHNYKPTGNSNAEAELTQNSELTETQTHIEKHTPSGELTYYGYKTPGVTNYNGITQNSEQSDLQTVQAPPPSLVLEKVYSPTGEFMYYRYKTPGVPNNSGIAQNSEQTAQVPSLTLEKVHSPSGEFLYYRYKTAGILNNNEQIIDNSEHFETQTAQTPPPSLILEKVYAPTGEFMYYIYRYKTAVNSDVEPVTSSTTERSQEPIYTEQMRFIVQMPYADTEQVANYPWVFDKFAYYPKNIQPLYVNTPVEYKPMFHMIRTLAIPGEYPASVLNEAQNTQNGGFDNQNQPNGVFETKN